MWVNEVSMEQRRNEGAAETGDPRENPPRPTASFCTIPTCENLGVTRPGIEPGSPWWEANVLIARAPRPLMSGEFPDTTPPPNTHTHTPGTIYLLIDSHTGLCEETPFLSELYVTGTLNCEVFWRRSTGDVSNKASSNDKRIAKALRADEGEVRWVWSSARIQGWGKREIPKKTRRTVASSATFLTCENSGETAKTKPGSPWWEAIASTFLPRCNIPNNCFRHRMYCSVDARRPHTWPALPWSQRNACDVSNPS
ncbi:hypothetical protein PR048_029660 [Dryococelus australis]|uniref:Uncharacterized protein n=1 Tax=Dryococelus australis TaxID=614101 RepID=A0ABQ9GE02_9NEOP|nr:hypothetical protein PR048_029660 [Dryococelus australis]